MVKKFFAVLLAAAMLLLVGCTFPPEETNDSAALYNPTDQTRNPTQPKNELSDGDTFDDSAVPPEDWTYLVKGGIAQFVVVAASEEYDKLAKDLARNLSDRTTVPFEYVKSSDKGNSKWLTRNQIVVGDALNKVLKSDETLMYNGNISRPIEMGSGYLKIHITGNHAEAVAISKQKFMNGCPLRYLVKKDNKVDFKVPNPRIYFFEQNIKNYKTTTPQILGRDLADYQIVFPKDMKAIDHYMAKYLLEEIGCNTGYVMNTVTDDAPEAECEIVFGKTSRAGSQALYETLLQGQFAVKSEGNKIYVAYENYLVASNARGALNNLYINKVTQPVDLRQTPDYSANKVTKSDASDIRVMTSNIVCAGDADGRETFEKGMGITWQQRVQIQGSMIMAYLPDFIGLQEMQNGYTYVEAYMHDELLSMISSKYSFVEYPGMAQNTYWNPIAYRHDVWQVEEKGTMYPGNFDDTMHRWQWALFSKIDDPSVQCIVLNLHYPISSRLEARQAAGEEVNRVIRELQSQYSYAPLFVTGDFNASEGSDLYNLTVQNTSLLNSNSAWDAIDLVLYDRTGVKKKDSYLIDDAFIKKTSDHKPFFADFKYGVD